MCCSISDSVINLKSDTIELFINNIKHKTLQLTILSKKTLRSMILKKIFLKSLFIKRLNLTNLKNSYIQSSDKYRILLNEMLFENKFVQTYYSKNISANNKSLFTPVSSFKNENLILKKSGYTSFKNFNHIDILRKLDIVDQTAGITVSGNRGYYLIDDGVEMNLALINYGMIFSALYKYNKLWTPFFIKKDIMKKCAQLEDFKYQLYKLKKSTSTYYLIATAEQTISSYISTLDLCINKFPLKFVSYSPCFRREVGSHGRDTKGIFRVHQFDKVEQFCLSVNDFTIKNNKFITLLRTSEIFYKSLGLPYQLVLLNEEELNPMAFIKIDIEGWFPGSRSYRELVSCTNCKNYQAKTLGLLLALNSDFSIEVNTFNSTLVATQRTICSIVENFQCKKGVIIPNILKSFLKGRRLIKYKIFF